MSVPALELRGLTKRFGSVTAVDRLTLTVNQGEIFGFLGPNGAGKSTTIRMLLNLLRADAGTALILGVPSTDVTAAHQHVAYVPGDVALWPQLTGRETLELLGNLSGRVDTAFRDELVARLRLNLDQRVRSYSKGNRQKVALVAAFMTRPDVLLLDEPTAGLDPLMEEQFQQLAREAAARGQTVFLSSHLLSEVEDVCSRVAILRRGRLVELAELATLQGLGSTVLEATFDGAPPRLDDLAGVSRVEAIPGGLRMHVAGSPAPVLARLAEAGVSRLRSHEPSLEEIFLGYYADPVTT
ncbi:ABC transporter ATP-binding protein [Sporichthya polymorpha]|uniref:ABC transporter ATP-binding protein n=1 Tax=Sporichthya polymorpha TaxID=35751 RepID=UPI0003A1053C|nr:ABC transporter ATP-binding protein [Sporichthya polymorpha]